MMQRVLWILWPAFLAACGAEMVFFAFIDPGEVHFRGEPVAAGPMTVYAAGFFFFWTVAAGSSALTSLLQRPPGNPGFGADPARHDAPGSP